MAPWRPETHRDPAIFLLTHLPAVLTCHPDRMPAFLGKAGIINDPRYDRSVLLHRWQDLLAHIIQQCLVTPGRLGHQMVQGLPRGLHIVRPESRGHRLDALSLTGQQQPFAVVLQRRVSIFVSRGGRQALYICRETLLLWAWRQEA